MSERMSKKIVPKAGLFSFKTSYFMMLTASLGFEA